MTAREIIDLARHTHKEIIVAVSGGKDSTALLELAIDTRPDNRPVHALWLDLDLIPTQTREYLERLRGRPEVTLHHIAAPIRKRNGYCLDPMHWTTHAGGIPGTARTPAGWEPWMGETDTIALAANQISQSACLLIGIRADESTVRRLARVNQRQEIMPLENAAGPLRGILNYAYPIMNWTRGDVWHYIQDKDHASTYATQYQTGTGEQHIRTACALSVDSVTGARVIAQSDPDLWERIDAMPGGELQRYTDTALCRVAETLGESTPVGRCQELIRYLVRRNARAGVRPYGVVKSIYEHTSRTADPILPTTPHPFSRIAYAVIIMHAARADSGTRVTVSNSAIGRQTLKGIRDGTRTMTRTGEARRYITVYEKLFGKEYKGELREWTGN